MSFSSVTVSDTFNLWVENFFPTSEDNKSEEVCIDTITNLNIVRKIGEIPQETPEELS